MLDVDRMFRQHRHDGEDQRQFAVAGAGDVEAHGVGVRRVDGFHHLIGAALLRPALALQQFEGKQHIFGSDRPAIGEMRARIEMKNQMRARRIDVDRLRDQRIEREGLILRTRHQALENIADQPLRRRSRFQVEGVKAVVGPRQADAEPAALGRLRIGVGEMIEAGRQRGVAMHGEAMDGRQLG